MWGAKKSVSINDNFWHGKKIIGFSEFADLSKF